MDEFEALAGELKRQLPPLPDDLGRSQLSRLRRDPRARRSRVRQRWLLLAVSAAIIGVVSSLPWPRHMHTPETRQLLDAESSALENVLVDGTRLVLDRGARGFSSAAADDGVRFTLERGRATFDVVPQKKGVFRVLAGKHSVSVIGTRFSVAFEPLGAFSVSVERGSVLVTPGEGSPVLLAAGERFDRDSDQPEAARDAESVQPSGVTRAPTAPVSPTSVVPPSPPISQHSAAHEPRWHQLHRKREYAAALAAARREGLERLLYELGPVLLTDLADVARLSGDLQVALQVLSAIERRFPATKEAQQAQFLSGRILVQLGRSREAVKVFESYLGTHPDGTLSTEALGRLLEIHANEGNTDRARPIAERYLERAPNGPYRRLARSLIGKR
jgi:TolA-binding protein